MSKDIKEYLHYYLGQFCDIPGHKIAKLVGFAYRNGEQWPIVEDYKNDKPHGAYYTVNWQVIKPILRKLESMTEDEAQELLKVRFNHPWQNPIYQRHSSVCIDFKFSSGPGEFSESQLDWDMLNSESFHYLLSRGFDLFQLIESGLAIDKETLVRPEIKKEQESSITGGG